MTDAPDESKPPWDSALAAGLVGKYILIGLTYCDHEGTVLEQKQMHGTIVSADATDGFTIQLQGARAGETFTLPPHIEAIQDAGPGEYRLRSTGETIVDPDLVSTWTINRPPPGDRPA